MHSYQAMTSPWLLLKVLLIRVLEQSSGSLIGKKITTFLVVRTNIVYRKTATKFQHMGTSTGNTTAYLKVIL